MLEWNKLAAALLGFIEKWPSDHPYLFAGVLMFISSLIFLHYNKEFIIDLKEKYRRQKKSDEFIQAISDDLKDIFEKLLIIDSTTKDTKDLTNANETLLDTLIKIFVEIKERRK